jgi:hypothetical protein
MTKIIFLDIDGVINASDLPPLYGEGWPESHLETHLIEKVNEIVKITDAQIVISSSWRIRFNLAELTEMLKNKGLKAKIIGVTPRIKRRFGKVVLRGEEIQDWLDAYPYKIEKFVILDDVADMGHLMPRLIKTEDEIGITDQHVELAIKMLQ